MFHSAKFKLETSLLKAARLLNSERVKCEAPFGDTIVFYFLVSQIQLNRYHNDKISPGRSVLPLDVCRAFLS